MCVCVCVYPYRRGVLDPPVPHVLGAVAQTGESRRTKQWENVNSRDTHPHGRGILETRCGCSTEFWPQNWRCCGETLRGTSAQ